MTKFIGLGHYSRTGKDTLAQATKQEAEAKGCTSQIRSFASKIKSIAHDLYGHLGMRDEAFYNTSAGEPFRDVKLTSIGKTPVEIWVEIGNNFRGVYADTWIDYVLKAHTDALDLVIIPDTRFLNEVEKIKELGGTTIKVTRPGVEPRDTVSDQALNDFTGWDLVFDNHAGFEEIKQFATEVVKQVQP